METKFGEVSVTGGSGSVVRDGRHGTRVNWEGTSDSTLTLLFRESTRRKVRILVSLVGPAVLSYDGVCIREALSGESRAIDTCTVETGARSVSIGCTTTGRFSGIVEVVQDG